MTTLSYSQNREDVLLARAFPPDHIGFYVDVGAWLPETDSVTKLFYDRGWSGINIEPGRDAFEELERHRPRDINLAVAVGAADGEATFFEYEGAFAARSTLDEELAEEYARDELAISFGSKAAFRVDVTTLASIFAEHVGDRIVDFLKVDVEGNERAVLEGADFSRFRPRIVMVEATDPGATVQTHTEWEPLLLDADYTFAFFDGLNRVYVDAAHPELADALGVPVNVFDDYEPAALVQTRERAGVAENENRVLRDRAEALARETEHSLGAAEDGRRDAWTARTLLAETRGELEAIARHNHELESSLAGARRTLAVAESELSPLRAHLVGRLILKLARLSSGVASLPGSPVPGQSAASLDDAATEADSASPEQGQGSPAGGYDPPMPSKAALRRALGWPLRRALNPRFQALAQEIVVSRTATHIEAASTRELNAAVERSLSEAIEQHVQAVIEVGASVGARLDRALSTLERIEARLDTLDAEHLGPSGSTQ